MTELSLMEKPMIIVHLKGTHQEKNAKFFEEIQIPVEPANPFVNMELAADIDRVELDIYAPRLVLSCGLALSELDDG